ncbi:hypothetical protein GCK72_022171 [Caenorhabditis remanei]|uniref:BHLH domain-containing protein n=1 Tax=Caenorhabditis remanei TaxID=31234 RepID=A0A6A5FT38_CAERE|nr:hypothetical protein GCK72_022171 [Caenorhabditis remanei]KAF1745724.1 hypothetical protein GCK72_022171 [Caenorhabditis remanei]
MSREKANARERCRQKSIGNAFTILRNHLPKQLRDRKPSKAETLKSATQYISHLLQVLEKDIKMEMNGQQNSMSPTASTPTQSDDNEYVGYQKGVWMPPQCQNPYNNPSYNSS